MNRADINVSIRFSTGQQVKPWEGNPEHYSIDVTGKIIAVPDLDEPDAEELAGEIKFSVLKLAEAIRDNLSTNFVFDCHSADLGAAWHVLFDEEESYNANSGITAPVGDVFYLDSIKLEPKYADNRLICDAIETAISSFATQSVVLIYPADLNDDVGLIQRLRLAPVPGARILVRDNCRRNRTSRSGKFNIVMRGSARIESSRY